MGTLRQDVDRERPRRMLGEQVLQRRRQYGERQLVLLPAQLVRQVVRYRRGDRRAVVVVEPRAALAALALGAMPGYAVVHAAFPPCSTTGRHSEVGTPSVSMHRRKPGRGGSVEGVGRQIVTVVVTTVPSGSRASVVVLWVITRLSVHIDVFRSSPSGRGSSFWAILESDTRLNPGSPSQLETEYFVKMKRTDTVVVVLPRQVYEQLEGLLAVMASRGGVLARQLRDGVAAGAELQPQARSAPPVGGRRQRRKA